MKSPEDRAFETEAVHAGLKYAEETGAVMPPIYQTSTFAYGNPGGFDYTRSGNPNFRNLEEVLRRTEGAAHACVFGSGVSAITAVVSTLKSGDVVVAEENVYGCTYRLFDQVFEKFGVEVKYFDFTKEESLNEIARLKPQLVWVESPTNPLLKIIDLQAVADACQAVGVPMLVDNTFASGYLQKPLELGATLSLTSTTKYCNGHSDALGGVVMSNDAQWQEKMIFAQKALGLQPDPFAMWLTQRGMKTMALRMERHSENALKFAQWLEGKSGVKWVRYPFLPSHPQHDLAMKQMSGGSGMVCVELERSLEACEAFLQQLGLFVKAESLGGVESLACHPASMTHASVPKEVREAVGISDSLIRFSIGIEAVEDLIADVEQAW